MYCLLNKKSAGKGSFGGWEGDALNEGRTWQWTTRTNNLKYLHLLTTFIIMCIVTCKKSTWLGCLFSSFIFQLSNCYCCLTQHWLQFILFLTDHVLFGGRNGLQKNLFLAGYARRQFLFLQQGRLWLSHPLLVQWSFSDPVPHRSLFQKGNSFGGKPWLTKKSVFSSVCTTCFMYIFLKQGPLSLSPPTSCSVIFQWSSVSEGKLCISCARRLSHISKAVVISDLQSLSVLKVSSRTNFLIDIYRVLWLRFYFS